MEICLMILILVCWGVIKARDSIRLANKRKQAKYFITDRHDMDWLSNHYGKRYEEWMRKEKLTEEQIQEEVGAVFNQIGELVGKGLEKYISLYPPKGQCSGNHYLKKMILQANRGYLDQGNELGFHGCFQSYVIYDEDGYKTCIQMPCSALNKFAEIITDKYAERGCPYTLIYRGGEFMWVTVNEDYEGPF